MTIRRQADPDLRVGSIAALIAFTVFCILMGVLAGQCHAKDKTKNREESTLRIEQVRACSKASDPGSCLRRLKATDVCQKLASNGFEDEAIACVKALAAG